MALPFTDYTSNAIADKDTYKVSGDGMFDKLMVTLTEHIDAQYRNNRVTGNDYATVYLGSIQAALTTSAKIFLEREVAEKQAELVDAQIALVTQQELESAAKTALIEAQTLTEAAKLLLVEAQTLGFKVDGKQKLYAQNMQSWAVFESVNKTNTPVNPITNVHMTDLYNEINSGLLGGVAI